MKQYISKNFFQLLAIALIIILFLQRSKSFDYNTNHVKSDTIYSKSYYYIKDTGISKPVFIKGERDTVFENSVEYIPSDDAGEFREQFEQLKQELLSRNIYKDQIKIDTFGTVNIIDTIQKNQIVGRSFINNLKIPENTITITNTIYPKAKNKWFIGGGVAGNQFKPINDFNLGMALLNKKDQLFELKGRIDLKGNKYVELNSYWKIKLKK